MNSKNLTSRLRRGESPVRYEDDGLYGLHRELDRLFDDVFYPFGSLTHSVLGLAPLWQIGEKNIYSFTPAVNVSETDKEIKVSAELPGMDKDDITVEVEDDAITIKGEKKEENEEKGKNWHRVEHAYGSFGRVIPLPAGVDTDKAKAKFKKGVLTINLPKCKKEQEKKKAIEIGTD